MFWVHGLRRMRDVCCRCEELGIWGFWEILLSRRGMEGILWLGAELWIKWWTFFRSRKGPYE